MLAACQTPVALAIQTGCEFAARFHHGPALEFREFVRMSQADEAERRLEVELLARIAQRDERAFAHFHERFAGSLYALALKIVNDAAEAEDVLQEGFLYMWRKAHTYDAGRSSPFTWAVMIVRNKAIDRLRMRQRQTRIVESATNEYLHFENADDVSALEPERRERCLRVRAALGEIAGDQRQAVELAFFGGLTHDQIAEQLATPLGTIKARIRRGLLRLRDCLKGGAA